MKQGKETALVKSCLQYLQAKGIVAWRKSVEYHYVSGKMNTIETAREPRAYDSRSPLTTTSFREPVMSTVKSTKVDCVCPNCQKSFQVIPFYAKKGRKYCSQQCASMHKRPNLRDRFYAKIKVVGDCWEWQGSRLKHGYGRIRTGYGNDREMTVAHRVSWEIHNNQSLSRSQFVMHKCDNPPCVNPDHLMLGTAKDNTQDMIKKGRKRYGTSPGEKNGSAKLSQAEVDQIRLLLSHGRKSKSIAPMYGVNHTTIEKIKTNKSWVRSLNQ